MRHDNANPECPMWVGAGSVYKRLQTKLATMAQNGHVTRSWHGHRVGWRCTPSRDMTDIIGAMNRGVEEELKAILLHGVLGRDSP